MQLKDKLPEMSEEEQLKILSSEGMLVKRPIIETELYVLLDLEKKSGKRN